MGTKIKEEIATLPSGLAVRRTSAADTLMNDEGVLLMGRTKRKVSDGGSYSVTLHVKRAEIYTLIAILQSEMDRYEREKSDGG